MAETFLHGVLYGFALSALLGGLIVFSIWWNPEIWLRSYPAPVRARFGRGMSATHFRGFVIGCALVAVPAAIGAAVVSLA